MLGKKDVESKELELLRNGKRSFILQVGLQDKMQSKANENFFCVGHLILKLDEMVM